MNREPRVAIIVVSYNTRGLLLDCLASVFEATGGTNIEVVVVDNASTDGSYEAARDAYPQATVTRNETNIGFGAACNQGIAATRAPLILLLNSDAQLAAQAFQSLCECMELNERCAAAGVALVNTSGLKVSNTRNFLTPVNQALELAGLKLGARWLQRSYRPSLDQTLLDCSVDWIDGACLMIRRAALDETAPFDERFFMYSEDEDLCFRLRKHGWLVCFCGPGTVVHHGAASSEQNSAEMLRHFYLSQLLFLSKHRGRGSAFVYSVMMRTVLTLKCFLTPDANRRRRASEQLTALHEARENGR